MKRIKFNKKNIFIFILILGIGTTLAYFTSTVTIPNIFNSAKYETTTTEQFTSPSDWTPGDTTPKTVITTNNSNMPIRVRISVEESWTDKNDNELDLEENGIKAAVLDLDNRPDWIYEDGYYYYRYDVAPNESTNSFIKSVTFNKEIVGEYICTTENNLEQCDSASDTYQDANYKLNIKVETTQADNYMDSWGLEHAPRRVDPTYCTYEGELEAGAEYVNGQYTYHYMQQKKAGTWEDIEDNGWGVAITNKDSTDPITTPLCTYINDIPVVSGTYMFYGTKATSIDTSTFDTSEFKHMSYMFSNIRYVENFDVSNIDTSSAIDANNMFYMNYSKTLDVTSLDTSNITNMQAMFASTRADVIDISDFDMSNVENTARMFSGAKVGKIILDDLDMSNVTNMHSMFSNTSATNISLKNIDTSNVESMASMFYNTSAENMNLRDLDTGSVTDMNKMFFGSKLQTLDLSNFDTSNVTDMNLMFASSEATSINLSSFDTSNVTDMAQMFYQANVTTLDLHNFDTSKVTNMNGMFYEGKFASLNLSGFDTGNVTDMSFMFSYNPDLSEILGVEDFDTSKVTNFRNMFYQNKLKRLDLKKWNTQSAVDEAFNRMFRNSGDLEYLDIRNFDTSGATTFHSMLCNLGKLTYLNIANLDSQNVTSFYYFTVNMEKIGELDFSGLKTSKVTDMSYLFHKLYAVRKIYISDLWDMTNVTKKPYMFLSNNNLTGDIDNHYTMKPRISDLALSDTSTRTIHVGESITITSVTATYTDSSVVVKNSEDLIWKSSDLDIAKANLGVIKGIAPGNATITIKSGIVETTFNVVVVE